MPFRRVADSPTFHLSRWLFLRLLGSIYLIAFLSLAWQITGLVGENGILPTNEYLEQVKKAMEIAPIGSSQRWSGCTEATLSFTFSV